MKKKQIDEFETLDGQLQAFYTEMNTLVKKNPNDALNSFKLKLVNSALQRANSILGKTRKPFADFDQFDEASMPTTSDVLVIVSQYLSALEQLRTENIYFSRVRWVWSVDDHNQEIRTAPPKKLGK
jgi:hypothetical protein